MAEDLYLLPPQILPCEHIDTPNLRYLNSEFALLRPLFRKGFDIKIHNLAWFDDKPPSRPPELLRDSSLPHITDYSAQPISDHYVLPPSINPDNLSPLQSYVDQQHQSSSFPLPSALPSSNPSPPSLLYDVDFLPPQVSTNATTLLASISGSIDKLLFIQFIPTNAMKPHWFLVQVDNSIDSDDDTLTAGSFFCTFLQCHPRDST